MSCWDKGSVCRNDWMILGKRVWSGSNRSGSGWRLLSRPESWLPLRIFRKSNTLSEKSGRTAACWTGRFIGRCLCRLSGSLNTAAGKGSERRQDQTVGLEKKRTPPNVKKMSCYVGVAGFEPATPCSQSRCANRTALYPDFEVQM